MNRDQPVRPANVVNIVEINQGRRPLTMQPPRAEALDTRRFAELIDGGHVVVDTRSPTAFGSGHVPGSYNIQLSSPEFEQRVGWVTPLDTPLLLVLESDTEADTALHALAFLGLDGRVRGYLAGGIRKWIGAGLRHQTVPQISVHELSERLHDDPQMQVLDVREIIEWDEGHIGNARSMSFKQLSERIEDLELIRDQPISVVCVEGMRSSTGCSILLANRFERVNNVTGGMSAWSAAGLPSAKDGAASSSGS